LAVFASLREIFLVSAWPGEEDFLEPELIVIPLESPGFDRFIGSWLCRGNMNILVDTGPASSAEGLMETLEKIGIRRLDLVLITHIHIDHAGGLARVLERFPGAVAVCHEKGIRHLVDPARLWEGSRHVLGDLARVYGPPRPVPPEKLLSHKTADFKEIEVIETPGHATHHLSFLYQGRLFPGEAAGNYLKVKGREYLRPATPSRFFLHEFLESLDRLAALGDRPIFYAHLDRAESSHLLIRRFRDQLLHWEKIIRREIASCPKTLMERCIEKLLKEDPNLAAIKVMGKEAVEREKTLMKNSVKGYMEYLEG
jgi:glyoxylase-like metal-dependent hydrolase (beta-lactamase superfamily II)